MLRIERVKKFKPGLVVWGEIMQEMGMEIVAGARYIAHQHGTPSINRPEIFENYNLLDFLNQKRFGTNESGSIIALSALFGARLGDCYGELLGDKPWADGETPHAIVATDFDCPNIDENKLTVVKALEKFPGNWSLLGTERGFHFISHTGVRPEHLIYHYGKMILRFIPFTDLESQRFFQRVGSWLTDQWYNPVVVKWVISEIMTNVKHMDEPEKPGFTLFPDTRYIAHSLTELLGFLKTKQQGFSFLRVTPKEPGRDAPYLTARKIGEDVILYQSESS